MGVAHGLGDQTSNRFNQQGYTGHRGQTPLPYGRLPFPRMERRESYRSGQLGEHHHSCRIHHIRSMGAFNMRVLPWIRLALVIIFILVVLL